MAAAEQIALASSAELVGFDVHPVKPWLAVAHTDGSFALIDYIAKEIIHNGLASDAETSAPFLPSSPFPFCVILILLLINYL